MAKRLLSTALLAVGVILVFTGLSAALGFTLLGMAASIAVIVALLYAGAVWVAPAPPANTSGIFLFDRNGLVVQGAQTGAPISAQFPASIRDDIERRCHAALAGHASRFVCSDNGRLTAFEAVPVRGADGAILYGVLMSGAASEVPVLS
jgi:hypothetical protein